MIYYLLYFGLHFILQKDVWIPVFSERTCIMNPIRKTIVILFLDLEWVDWSCLVIC